MFIGAPPRREDERAIQRASGAMGYKFQFVTPVPQPQSRHVRNCRGYRDGNGGLFRAQDAGSTQSRTANGDTPPADVGTAIRRSPDDQGRLGLHDSHGRSSTRARMFDTALSSRPIAALGKRTIEEKGNEIRSLGSWRRFGRSFPSLGRGRSRSDGPSPPAHARSGEVSEIPPKANTASDRADDAPTHAAAPPRATRGVRQDGSADKQPISSRVEGEERNGPRGQAALRAADAAAGAGWPLPLA